jgi:hypothetical protein
MQAAHRGGYDALRLVDIPQPQSRAGHAPALAEAAAAH